jgi:hypothetical protein
MREVVFDNGHVLRINVASFSEAKALFEAVTAELRGVPVTSQTQILTLFKDLFCTGFSSRAIDSAIWPCFARCTYGEGEGVFPKVTKATFEPEATRENYTRAYAEVLKENVGPFAKDLSYLLEQVSNAVESYQKSLSEEKPTT